MRSNIGKGCADGVEKVASGGGGQKSIAEAVQSARGDLAPIEDDVAGEVLVVASQSIGGPGPHAGSTLEAASTMEEKVGTGVLGKARGHRLDDTELICHLRHVGEQVADPGSALAALPEGPWGLKDLSD